MQINRTSIITGPARITFAGQTFWSKGDITVTYVLGRFNIDTSSFGKVDERISAKSFTVAFEPDGRFTAALAAVCWPYASLSVGASPYGDTDRALVINSRDGKQFTFHNAAVTTMPSLRLGVAQTMQGSMTFTALLKNNTDPTNAAAYCTIASVAYPGDADFATSDIKTLAYTSAWGEDAPWDSFMTEAGWEIGFNLQLAPMTVDGLGVIDMRLQSLEVTATAIPVGPTEADLLGKMGLEAAFGSSLASGDDLIVSAAGVYFSLSKAAVVQGPLRFGNQVKRLGSTQWVATRSVTAGSLDPLFVIDDAAPEEEP